jgi:hypothetical protein
MAHRHFFSVKIIIIEFSILIIQLVRLLNKKCGIPGVIDNL